MMYISLERARNWCKANNKDSIPLDVVALLAVQETVTELNALEELISDLPFEGNYRPQHYLYHVTPTENVERIIKEGLKFSPDGVKRCFIYLSELPYSWVNKDSIDKVSILQVDVSDLEFDKINTCWRPEIDELIFMQEIPPLTKSGEQRFTDVTSVYIDKIKE